MNHELIQYSLEQYCTCCDLQKMYLLTNLEGICFIIMIFNESLF